MKTLLNLRVFSFAMCCAAAVMFTGCAPAETKVMEADTPAGDVEVTENEETGAVDVEVEAPAE